ncbi:hypothetical protein DFQ28_006694 [Apophysomyces sp. BC1034]|nr:hypothetical protein DFQ30_004848 [Apophysomyces sp. BC1015]KAG0169510.1 hypothetical protein DFQ29_009653 [Apophysomyces sp. BC1021]KAG0187229.1 hypothetical protein DFQ28_006694 [Apophysomyces sp. BC1034]
MSNRYQKLPTSDDPVEAEPSSVDRNISHTSHSSSPSLPPAYTSPPPLQQQQHDLEAAFDAHNDDIEYAESHRLLEPSPTPSTAAPARRSSSANRPAVLPVTNDGVFSNMSAKPESDSAKPDETPPAYEEAAADSTPPYWQTTIIAPAGMGDIILVEGLPVGHLFNFFWNLLVSASFQFVGFMLTYLLHTTHAAKHGSRAGLGVSLVQYGFYIRSRGALEDRYYDDESQPPQNDEANANANIVAYFLMMLGWFIIIRAVADYIRAKRMERIIAAEPNAESIV